MKAAFVKDSSKVVVEDVSKPEMGSGDVLVRMSACGICGSDLEKVYGKYCQPSTRLGHEPSGIITDVGKMFLILKKAIVFLFITTFHATHVTFVNMEMRQCAKNILKPIFLHVD